MSRDGGMRPVHLVGLFLWRGGLLLAGAAVLFEAVRFLLRFFDLPFALCLGLGLALAGLGLVLISLIWENIADSRRQGKEEE